MAPDMDEFRTDDVKIGDVLIQIGRFEHWTVVEDLGFFYSLERRRSNGIGEIRVQMPKSLVDGMYVKVNGAGGE